MLILVQKENEQDDVNLFRMDIFRAAYGWEVQKGPPPYLKSVTHILQ